METKKRAPPFPIPRRNVRSFIAAGLLALLHPSDVPSHAGCTVAISSSVSIYSCGDSVGIAPNFPIKLHLVVPR